MIDFYFYHRNQVNPIPLPTNGIKDDLVERIQDAGWVYLATAHQLRQIIRNRA